ncbi:MAG TPA: hypothetical protein VHX42_04440, partial [Candidatus Babeliales bacterium]|nr:hypothetical protein [Candidatus Babeliales bacterium]
MNKQHFLVFFSCLFFSSLQLFCDESYLDLSTDRSDLAHIVAEISSWDNNKNSVLWQLQKHIAEGNAIALEDSVVEALAYAEHIVEQQYTKLSAYTFDQINDALDRLLDAIENGELQSFDTKRLTI